jgi:hypothetical protein
VTKSESIAKALNVTSYPAIRVIPAGHSSATSEAVHFNGKVSFFSIDLFLMDYAKPAASSEETQGSKTSKGGDAPKDAKDKAKAEKASDAQGATKRQPKAADTAKEPKPKADAAKEPKPKADAAKEPKPKAADKEQKPARGKADAKQRNKEPEPPVYGGSPKKESKERRGGEL